jgi:hypothetical protein
VTALGGDGGVLVEEPGLDEEQIGVAERREAFS